MSVRAVGSHSTVSKVDFLKVFVHEVHFLHPEVFTLPAFAVGTEHHVHSVVVGKHLVPVGIHVECPRVARHVGVLHIGVSVATEHFWSRNVATPSVHTGVCSVWCVVVVVQCAECVVGVESYVLGQVGFQETSDASQVVTALGSLGSLAVEDTVGAVITVDCAIRAEERTPAPLICVSVTPLVRAVILLVAVVETDTCLQPVGDVGAEVEGCGVTFKLVGVEFVNTLARVVAETCIECGAASRPLHVDVVLHRRSSAIENVFHVPVGIIECAATVVVHVVVTHIVPALEALHLAIAALLAVVLLLPSLSVWKQLVEIHAEKLVVHTHALVSLAESVNLARHACIVGQIC